MQGIEPRIRIRVGHSKTLREGWGYETTVEIEGGLSEGVDGLLQSWLQKVRQIAEIERDMRNQRDGDRST